LDAVDEINPSMIIHESTDYRGQPGNTSGMMPSANAMALPGNRGAPL